MGHNLTSEKYCSLVTRLCFLLNNSKALDPKDKEQALRKLEEVLQEWSKKSNVSHKECS